jgi:hypothetical protein
LFTATTILTISVELAISFYPSIFDHLLSQKKYTAEFCRCMRLVNVETIEYGMLII